MLLAGNARPAVAHADHDPSVRRGHLDVHELAALRPLHGVVDQVREDLPQSHTVAAHRRERPAHDGPDSHLVLAERRRRDSFLRQLADVDVVEAVGERPRLDARRVEDVRDQVGEPPRLPGDQREERAPPRRCELAPALFERLCGSDHRRHRAAQLVGHEGDEVRAESREPTAIRATR